MIYYFIENLTELNPKEEIVIDENLVLKAIPQEHQCKLKEIIKIYYPNKSDMMNAYVKNDFVKSFHEFKKSSVGISRESREPHDFRYFVLEERGSRQFNLF